jgi:hypothetical protein
LVAIRLRRTCRSGGAMRSTSCAAAAAKWHLVCGASSAVMLVRQHGACRCFLLEVQVFLLGVA